MGVSRSGFDFIDVIKAGRVCNWLPCRLGHRSSEVYLAGAQRRGRRHSCAALGSRQQRVACSGGAVLRRRRRRSCCRHLPVQEAGKCITVHKSKRRNQGAVWQACWIDSVCSGSPVCRAPSAPASQQTESSAVTRLVAFTVIDPNLTHWRQQSSDSLSHFADMHCAKGAAAAPVTWSCIVNNSQRHAGQDRTWTRAGQVPEAACLRRGCRETCATRA